MRKLNYFMVFCLVMALLACSEKPVQYSASSNKLATKVGVREGGVIKANGQAGFLVYGPYNKIDVGVYRLVAKGKLTGPNAALGNMDVAAEKGQRILATKPLVAQQTKEGEIGSLNFEVIKPIDDIEFRINVSAQTTGTFSGYEITKINKLDEK